MQSLQKPTIRRTKKQIKSLLHLSQNYPGTIIQFCKAHKIQKGTFYNWRNKYGTAATENEPAFIPLQISNQLQDQSLFAEIEFSPEVTIRLFQKVEAAWFKSLL